MLTDSVSYEDLCDEIRINFKSFDSCINQWRGRKIDRSSHDLRIPSIHASSVAYKQKSVGEGDIRGKEQPSFPRISVGSPLPSFSDNSPKIDEGTKQVSTATSESQVGSSSEEKEILDSIKGFAHGATSGAIDSIKELPSTISDTLKAAGNYVLDPFIHPLNHALPGQELVLQALSLHESIAYLQTIEKGELAKILVPEVYELCTNWDLLSPQERASLAGYALGKYGTDFYMPLGIAKGIKKVANLANLRAAAGTVLKEASSVAKVKKVAEAAIKQAETLDAIPDSLQLAKKGISHAELTPVQKYLLSEELKQDLAEVIQNTKIAMQSEAFAEGSALAEEINRNLNNVNLTSPQIDPNFRGLEKQLFSTALEGKTITGVDLNLESLLKAGLAPDKAGFSKAGRALMKHGYREGSVFPKPVGNAAEINEHGQKVLESILTHPKKIIYDRPHPDFERVIDITIPGKGGVRFTPAGEMIGFLEPN